MNWLEQIRYAVEEVPAVVAVERPAGLSADAAEGLLAVMPAIDSIVLIGWVVTGGVLVAGAILLTVLVIRHNRGLARRLARLESELTVYTEASTRVAQTLEGVLLGRTPSSQTMHTSRRYLLLQARERLHRGESPQGIARGLGLSHDEVRLLEHARLSSQGCVAGVALSQQAQRPEPSYARPVSVELPVEFSQTRSSQQTEDRRWNLGAL